jgi:formylglycine-generating enzyme required for sulfatase activity
MNGIWLKLTLLAVSTVVVQAADLKSYKDVYDNNLEEIVLGHGPRLAELGQQYLKSLEALRAKVQGDGDLEKTKAVMAEIEKFQKDKNVAADSTVPEIRKLQAAAAKQMSDMEMDKARKVTTLATQYDAALERLQKELTKAGKLDEATAIQEERNKVKNSDYLLSASRVAATMPGKESTTDTAEKPSKKPVTALLDRTIELNLGKGVKMKLTLIQAGKFIMGSPEAEAGRSPHEGPQREVTISKPFYMGVCEVRQDEYETVMNNNPSEFKGKKLPVEMVTWDDALAFCKMVSTASGKNVRLPTEAEWEYACRAGTRSRFSYGDKDEDFCKYGNYCDRSCTASREWRDEKHSDGFDKTAPVGSFKPNAWGLYDMHGNIWEWCSDRMSESYEGLSSLDPQGIDSGNVRVVRGGGWGGPPAHLRSAKRMGLAPGVKHPSGGFRVVVECQ